MTISFVLCITAVIDSILFGSQLVEVFLKRSAGGLSLSLLLAGLLATVTGVICGFVKNESVTLITNFVALVLTVLTIAGYFRYRKV
jgi:hypothetical protein